MNLDQRLKPLIARFASDLVRMVAQHGGSSTKSKRPAANAGSSATSARRVGHRPCIAPGCKKLGSSRNHWLCQDHKGAPAAKWKTWAAK